MDVSIRKETLNWWGGVEALKLFHISDIHLKWATTTLTRIHRRLLEHRPDLVLFTGDYYDTPAGCDRFLAFVRDIGGAFRCVLIRGNHERWFRSAGWFADALAAIPAAVDLEAGDFHYTSERGCRYRFSSHFNGAPAGSRPDHRSIVLVHNPETIVESQAAGVDLILAGHLHGGQVALRRSADRSLFPGNLLYRYCIDRTRIGPATLIVSRGLGDTLPIRYRCPREIVMIEIE